MTDKNKYIIKNFPSSRQATIDVGYNCMGPCQAFPRWQAYYRKRKGLPMKPDALKWPGLRNSLPGSGNLPGQGFRLLPLITSRCINLRGLEQPEIILAAIHDAVDVHRVFLDLMIGCSKNLPSRIFTYYPA